MREDDRASGFWELVIEMWIGVSERTMGRVRGRRFLPLVVTAFGCETFMSLAQTVSGKGARPRLPSRQSSSCRSRV